MAGTDCFGTEVLINTATAVQKIVEAVIALDALEGGQLLDDRIGPGCHFEEIDSRTATSSVYHHPVEGTGLGESQMRGTAQKKQNEGKGHVQKCTLRADFHHHSPKRTCFRVLQ